MPPVRCGSSAASSPMQRHTMRPMITTRAMAGMAAAPMEDTAKGTMPVTRMVPARPITKAPHQLVPRLREVATSGGLVTCSLMCGSPLGWEGSCRLFLFVSGSLVPRAAPARRARSEGLEVALQLPARHLGVRGAHLVALGLDEVVDVVAVGRLAQAFAQ